MAQAETPPIFVRNSSSSGRLSHFARAPVATMTVSAVISPLASVSRNGLSLNAAAFSSPVANSAPNRSACLRMRSMRSGPRTPSGKPG